MKNITVVANIKIKKEYKNEVFNELLKLHKATNQNDKGCIQYILHKDLDDENSFTFIETWENEVLLSEHTQKKHFLDFVSFVDGKLKSMTVKKLEKID